MQRRHFLASTGLALTTTVAGCGEDTEDIEGGSRDETDTPEDDGEAELEETTETPTSEEGTPEGEASLEITNHELHVEEGDFSTDVFVEAVIENSGDGRSGNIELQADWYDADGNYLGNDTEWLTTLNAGETWEARVYYFGGDSDDIDDYEIDGEFSPPSGTIDPEGLELLSSEMSVSEDDREAEVRGEVENTSGDDQDYVAAIAKVSDDAGVVLGDDWTNVTDLRAGETWRFSIGWRGRDRTSRAASHEVLLTDSI